VKFPDYFSNVASDYAAYRPQYPATLFEWLASLCPRHELAWDCACGSGQASRPLAGHFDLVVGTDASPEQVAAAEIDENTRFAVAMSEQVPLAKRSADLVTVAQALHWFACDAFYAEVDRVIRPGGVFAAWTYGMPHFASDDVERVVHEFIDGPLGPYWPAEVRMVLDGYSSIGLPFLELESPEFAIDLKWSPARYLDFVRTWSAVGRYIEEGGEDPVAQLESELQRATPRGNENLAVSYRLDLRVCRV